MVVVQTSDKKLSENQVFSGIIVEPCKIPFNSFKLNIPFLHLQKTFGFLTVSGGYEMG